MNIIFDLDGTLLNSKNRLFQLFQRLCSASNLTYEEYWLLKTSGMSHQEILNVKFKFTPEQIIEFTRQWMQLIESEDLLQLDYLFENVPEMLSTLSQSHKLYLCTARQSEPSVIRQLKRLNIFNVFEKVLVTKQQTTKVELIRLNVSNRNKNDWIVGDTGADINVGRELNINACAVSCGFLSREVLERYHPDAIFNLASELPLFFKNV